MIFPQVDLETWKKRFNLPVVEARCGKCGQIFKTTVPILLEDCAGLSTPIHECGEEFSDVVLTPKSPKAKEFWRSVFRQS